MSTHDPLASPPTAPGAPDSALGGEYHPDDVVALLRAVQAELAEARADLDAVRDELAGLAELATDVRQLVAWVRTIKIPKIFGGGVPELPPAGQ